MLLEEAVQGAGGKLEKPEIFRGATDASFYRIRGLPAIGFSAIANTPSLAHDHNEVRGRFIIMRMSIRNTESASDHIASSCFHLFSG